MITRTLPSVLVALFLLGAYGCDSTKEAEMASLLTRLEEESRAKKASFAAKHNAVVDWQDLQAGGFTLELQDALIRQDGRPILESVFLEDVRRDAEGLVAQFYSPLVGSVPYCDCRWQLRCTPEQARELMQPGSLESYLIIARVSRVKRGLIPQSREDNDGPAGVIVITGQLVDYIKE